MEQAIFVFTMSVCIMASIKMGGAMLGNGVTLPNLNTYITPTSFLFMYPSVIYQVYFWSTNLFN